MSWYTVFYFFSLADKISHVTGIFASISGVILGFTIITWIFNRDADNLKHDFTTISAKIWRTFFWTSSIAFFINIFLWTFIPDRKDMLVIIAGGSVGEFISGDKNAQAIPHDITRFLRKEILEATMEEGNEALKEAIGIESEVDKLQKLSKEELINLLKDKENP